MIYVNHTSRTITRQRAAELAAAHIAGVIQRVGAEHAATLLAETLPSWTAESYRKASDPKQADALIAYFAKHITDIQ